MSAYLFYAEKAGFRRPWRSALVVKGLDRKVPYLPLARRHNYLWAKHGHIQIFDLKNGCYMIRFRCQEDYEGTIMGGHWLLGDTYLTVHKWFKGFDPWTTSVTTTMVWVTLPYLPIEFYNLVAVTRIASRIGKPVRVDRATKECARGKYARVCVEVDLSKPLLPKYKVEGVTYLVVYEGFHKICTKCGMYGASVHSFRCCEQREPDPTCPAPIDSQQPRDHSNGEVFGDWMMLKRKAWRRNTSVPLPPNHDVKTGRAGIDLKYCLQMKIPH
ncbi:hypothetical protein LINGRAHAP2_LOCUS37194 [Linum grandiflorum]